MTRGDGEPAYRSICRVAFQGEHGAFSEAAALHLMNGTNTNRSTKSRAATKTRGETNVASEIETVPRATFEALFAAIDDSAADYILAPIENTLAGSVHRCYDLLIARDLRIRAEAIHPIAHYLVGPKSAIFAAVKSVESHPVALAQCEKFFERHPEIKRVVAQDTAGSVRDVTASGDLTRAAIGSKHAAELYGGTILAEHLEDDPANFTRFLLLSTPDAPEPKITLEQAAWKMSLMLHLSHKPGSLCAALDAFAKRGINLLKIESRPLAGRPWEYRFYLDLAATAEDAQTQSAMAELRSHVTSALELGSYRAAANPVPA